MVKLCHNDIPTRLNKINKHKNVSTEQKMVFQMYVRSVLILILFIGVSIKLVSEPIDIEIKVDASVEYKTDVFYNELPYSVAEELRQELKEEVIKKCKYNMKEESKLIGSIRYLDFHFSDDGNSKLLRLYADQTCRSNQMILQILIWKENLIFGSHQNTLTIQITYRVY